MRTIRACRLAITCHEYEEIDELKDLPDEYRLNKKKIPPALEYISWEIPWTRKLYTVERERRSTIAKMTYMNTHHLPDRIFNPNLTWTNDSVFDHVGTGREDN